MDCCSTIFNGCNSALTILFLALIGAIILLIIWGVSYNNKTINEQQLSNTGDLTRLNSNNSTSQQIAAQNNIILQGLPPILNSNVVASF